MLRFPAELGTRSGQNTEGEERGLAEALAVSGCAAASPGFLHGALAQSSNGLCVWVCVCVRACLSALAVSGDAGVSWPGEALSRSPPPSLHGLPHACVCVTFPLEKGRQPRGIRAHPTPVRLPPYQSHLPGPCLQIRSHPKSWSQDSMYEF